MSFGVSNVIVMELKLNVDRRPSVVQSDVKYESVGGMASTVRGYSPPSTNSPYCRYAD
jgi:hypothetical protein